MNQVMTEKIIDKQKEIDVILEEINLEEEKNKKQLVLYTNIC